MENYSRYFAEIVTTVLIAFALFIITHQIFSDKKITGYTLESQSSDKNNGVPVIRINMNNTPDSYVILSKEISWSKAIQMVDSLNMQLIKYKIK